MKIKRYGLLENGQIEPLYYGDTDEMRDVAREGRRWYLYHREADVFKNLYEKLLYEVMNK